MPRSRASPLPDPPGMMPSAGAGPLASSRCTSARPTSLIVPSPPHAMTRSAPDAAASSASSCAWPPRSVRRISPFTPSRSSVRVASSTRSAPVPRRLGPETGLMMMTVAR